ncbi:MAG: hypothetical protein Q7S31_00910 [bacterium]|nr:hypothetical protein [bacterium]
MSKDVQNELELSISRTLGKLPADPDFLNLGIALGSLGIISRRVQANLLMDLHQPGWGLTEIEAIALQDKIEAAAKEITASV